jgi:hypothetical protein
MVTLADASSSLDVQIEIEPVNAGLSVNTIELGTDTPVDFPLPQPETQTGC